ncbi:MAG: hypothetical protein ACKV2V_11685 [Blastocatellia bacterium]
MEKNTRRRYEMFQRVREFGARHQAVFSERNNFQNLFTRLEAVINKIEAASADRSAQRNNRKSGTAARSGARTTLQGLMLTISRTARVLSLDHPGMAEKFSYSPGDNDQTLRDKAQAFLRQATPLRDLFIQSELAPDFLDTLRDSLAEFNAAGTRQTTSFTGQQESTSAMNAAGVDGLEIVTRLDMLIRNKYATDRDMLTAWQIASRLERTARGASGSGDKTPE